MLAIWVGWEFNGPMQFQINMLNARWRNSFKQNRLKKLWIAKSEPVFVSWRHCAWSEWPKVKHFQHAEWVVNNEKKNMLSQWYVEYIKGKKGK